MMNQSKSNKIHFDGRDSQIDATLSSALESGNSVEKLEFTIEELREAISQGGNKIQGIIPICSQCRRVRDRFGQWHFVDMSLLLEGTSCFSHGLCQRCAKLLFGEEMITG